MEFELVHFGARRNDSHYLLEHYLGGTAKDSCSHSQHHSPCLTRSDRLQYQQGAPVSWISTRSSWAGGDGCFAFPCAGYELRLALRINGSYSILTQYPMASSHSQTFCFGSSPSCFSACKIAFRRKVILLTPRILHIFSSCSFSSGDTSNTILTLPCGRDMTYSTFIFYIFGP